MCLCKSSLVSKWLCMFWSNPRTNIPLTKNVDFIEIFSIQSFVIIQSYFYQHSNDDNYLFYSDYTHTELPYNVFSLNYPHLHSINLLILIYPLYLEVGLEHLAKRWHPTTLYPHASHSSSAPTGTYKPFSFIPIIHI